MDERTRDLEHGDVRTQPVARAAPTNRGVEPGMTLDSKRGAVQNPLVRYATDVGWTYVNPNKPLRLRRGRDGTVLPRHPSLAVPTGEPRVVDAPAANMRLECCTSLGAESCQQTTCCGRSPITCRGRDHDCGFLGRRVPKLVHGQRDALPHRQRNGSKLNPLRDTTFIHISSRRSSRPKGPAPDADGDTHHRRGRSRPPLRIVNPVWRPGRHRPNPLPQSHPSWLLQRRRHEKSTVIRLHHVRDEVIAP
jgi:hypothetical protein